MSTYDKLRGYYLLYQTRGLKCDGCNLGRDYYSIGHRCFRSGLFFHNECAESSVEIHNLYHPQHSLHIKVLKQNEDVHGECKLCRAWMSIVKKNPPSFTLFHPKAHEHSLTLMPQRSFVCSACGMDDDPNPYVCPQCNFMIHRSCIDRPRVIKIYRHDHHICYNNFLDAGDWKCGICHKKINWTCGAYSCSECPDLAMHLRCATRFGIWDGIELEGISKNTLKVKSYKEIEEGVIKHFSHEHTLKFKEEIDGKDECIRCTICTYPIFSSPLYSCMECDDFILHKKCADLPKKKIDSFYKMSTSLITNYQGNAANICNACQSIYQGFSYLSDDGNTLLDVRCGSISEPFFHESHPHSLYVSYSTGDRFCNACGEKATMVLSCEECEFVLDMKCSTLPKIVKHENDKDHLLSLCYGENKYAHLEASYGLNRRKILNHPTFM
ncbi:unnamed protein product [Arabidopsis thaliana]|uniref:DC1 domain-containing protein n=1 Tax=Arabidopsis thaliana TaxID=3702 RepID=A0A5S9XS37_ARATH|nr:unnamed protein product [Arabidopsis thaliana]